MLRASSIWAILVSVTLTVMEVRANWGGWQWWPWWLVDFNAAAMLLFGGWRTLVSPATGKAWLAAAWSFTLGMAWMSLAGNAESGPDPTRDARVGGFYLLLVGSLVLSATAGLMLALFGKPSIHQTG